jgi:hypothetical protein
MTEYEPREADIEPDPIADTTMFQAFVSRPELADPTDPQRAVGAPFRLATLLVGLGVFAGLVWLLLRL